MILRGRVTTNKNKRKKYLYNSIFSTLLRLLLLCLFSANLSRHLHTQLFLRHFLPQTSLQLFVRVFALLHDVLERPVGVARGHIQLTLLSLLS